MSRRACWPPAAPAAGPSFNKCAPGHAVAPDPAAGGHGVQPLPASPTAASVAPGGPLPRRSGAGSTADAQVQRWARIADLHEQLAEAYRGLARDAEIQLAACQEPGLMSSMETAQARPRLLRVQDLAERLQVDERTIRRMRARGELPPAIDLHSVLRWDEATVDAWLEGRRER